MTSKNSIAWGIFALTFISFLSSFYKSIPIVKFDNDESIKDISSPLNNITLKEFFSAVSVSSGNVFQIYPFQPIFNYRALCSLESWAFNHPNASIWYTFTVNTIQDEDGLIQKLLSKYLNLNFIYVDLKKIFNGTPLNKFTNSSPWTKSSWPGTHLSDLLRQALLWHKGGYYSDSDVYPVKSLNVLRNFMNTYAGSYVTDACLMHFDAHHPFVKGFMETIANDFQPKNYMHQGPIAGWTTGKRLCNSPGDYFDPDAIGKSRNCTIDGKTFHFLNPQYCLLCRNACLKPGTGKMFSKFVQDSYCFHAGNGASRKIPETFTSESLLQVMAAKNCPLIYKQAHLHSNFW